MSNKVLQKSLVQEYGLYLSILHSEQEQDHINFNKLKFPEKHMTENNFLRSASFWGDDGYKIIKNGKHNLDILTEDNHSRSS